MLSHQLQNKKLNYRSSVSKFEKTIIWMMLPSGKILLVGKVFIFFHLVMAGLRLRFEMPYMLYLNWGSPIYMEP